MNETVMSEIHSFTHFSSLCSFHGLIMAPFVQAV